MRILKSAILLPLLALGACANHAGSAEQHARHYVYQTRDDFDPQFRTDVNSSIKNAIPMFEQFYQLGKKDRAAGVARGEAQKKADYLASPEFQQGMERKSVFINHTYSSTANAKYKQVLSQEAVGAFWDGYEGR
ncbi:Exc2 family lipoprotein [Serratia ficaria]|uniref:Exc2 family lipoprotein n=1 Tax=Serratia ficaria TaxID=61651 RepID=UPI002ED2F893|nr:Exc2 family lipoprotein [Serratia ficaria]